MPTPARELTEDEIKKYKLPPGGNWWQFTGSQALAIDLYRSSPREHLIVAWDWGANAVKMYGVYKMNQETFATLLLDVPWRYRNAYELLIENEPCCAYADIEWNTLQKEDGPPKIAEIVKSIRSKIERTYHVDAEIYVCCSSRPLSCGKYKHSYHVVVRNVAFGCNNDDLMKNLFASIEGFEWQDDSATPPKKKTMIDLSVYTTNRVFRIATCAKGGGASVPLTRISGDPFANPDDLGAVWDERDHKNTILPFMISKPVVIEGTTCFIPAQPKNQQSSSAGTKRPRESSAVAGGVDRAVVAVQKPLPVRIEIIQSLLRDCGDTVTTLGPARFNEGESKWQMQGSRPTGPRKCLMCPKGSITHQSNNALLFVEFKKKKYYVHFFCTSSTCKKTTKQLLGYISYDADEGDWTTKRLYQQSDPPKKQTRPRLAAPLVQPVAARAQHIADEMDLTDAMELVEESQQVAESEDMERDAEGNAMEECSDNDEGSEQNHGAPAAAKPYDKKDPLQNTYEMVKARFENESDEIVRFKLREPFQYIEIRNVDKKVRKFNEIGFAQYLQEWFFFGNDSKTGKMTRQKFITRWLGDDEKKVYDRWQMAPTGTPPDVFNLWRGFTAETLPPPISDEVAEADFKPFFDHVLDVFCRGNMDHAKWVIEYFASIVQYPGEKTGVAILLHGIQGCGKGVLIEFLRTSVLGNHCSMKTANAARDLFKDFANGVLDNILVQIDELGDIKAHADALKDLITDRQTRFEGKCKDTITVPNMCNFIFTTNNTTTLAIDQNDRRTVAFDCSPVRVKDIKYFAKLCNHLQRKETASAVWHCLRKVDLSKYHCGDDSVNFNYTKPKTELLEEMQRSNIPIFTRFLSAIVNDNMDKQKVVLYSGGIFFEKYVTFGKNEDAIKFSSSQTAFGHAIKPMIDEKNLTGFDKVRGGDGFKYKIDVELLKNYLVSKRQYNCNFALL